MAYTVTIIHHLNNMDPVAAAEALAKKAALNISRIWTPEGCYADSKPLEGTVYDTNVEGFGSIADVEPYATTSVPMNTALAQFKLAVVGEEVKSHETVTGHKVKFTVDTYQEAFAYKQFGVQLKDQGFEVTIEEVAASVPGGVPGVGG